MPLPSRKPGSFGSALRGMWALTAAFRRRMYYGGCIILVTSALELVAPYVTKLLIDGLTAGTLPLVPALQLVGFGVGVELFVDALYYHQSTFINRTHLLIEMDLTDRGLGSLLGLSLGYHEQGTSGQKSTRITRGSSNVNNILSSMYWDVLPTVATLATTAVALAFVAWWVAGVFLVAVPVFVALTFYLDRRNRPLRKAINDGFERVSGQITQASLHVQTVQTTGQEAFETGRIRRTTKKIVAAIDQQRRLYNTWGYMRSVTNIVSRGTIIALCAAAVLAGSFTIGTFALVATLTSRAMEQLFRLSRTYDRVADAAESVNRLIALLHAESAVRESPEAVPVGNVAGGIALEGVSFGYRTDRGLALRSVSMEILPGQFVALVGPSGSGKSTLAKLLLRHYDPTEGGISLDGRDLRTLRLRELRRSFGVVSQDVELFNGTVRDNIAYAEPDASMERIEAAARLAFADEFIAKLPKGYATKIGERGIKLSGGQRQRIGIARALLLEPRILIFDEATSNLDSESERRIQEALEVLRRGRTVIVIAHRLSTIQRADRIFVLEGGNLVASGTHDDLRRGDGIYARLAALQSMGELRT